MRANLLPALGVAFAAFFWIIDSVIDALLFDEEESILESLLSPDPVELWMRSLVIVLMIAFSFYARHLLRQQVASSNELLEYKNQLEKIVASRTTELQSKNKALQNEILVRKKMEETLEKIAITDPLTSLYNRRKFSEILTYEIERERRHKSGLSLIMCDLDHFKQINDQYGHNVGDQVLQQFSYIIKNSIRKSDYLARWGGEEFILLIPDTDSDLALVITEKLRKLIDESDFKDVGYVTASFGLATFMGSDTEKSLVDHADKALYQAKENGRNQVVVANNEDTQSAS